MWQYLDIVIVATLVLAAMAYLARLGYRRLSGREKSCGSCGPKEGAKKTVLTIGGKAAPRR